MQLYVNYFDEEVVTANDNPTIGLILCTKKNDAMTLISISTLLLFFFPLYRSYRCIVSRLPRAIKKLLSQLRALSNSSRTSPENTP